MEVGKRESIVLIVGVDVGGMGRISQHVNETLHQFDTAWKPGYQYAAEFDKIGMLLRMGFRPNVIFMTNEVGLDDEMYRSGVIQLAERLKDLELSPWISVEVESLAWVVNIFLNHGFKAHFAPLVGVITDEEDSREAA